MFDITTTDSMAMDLSALSDLTQGRARLNAPPVKPRRIPTRLLRPQRVHSVAPSSTLLNPSIVTQSIPLVQSNMASNMSAAREMSRTTPKASTPSQKRPKLLQGGETALTSMSKSQEAQLGFNTIKLREDHTPQLLRLAMDTREQGLKGIEMETVNQALYGLLKASRSNPCAIALADLASALKLKPCPYPVMVDNEGNPFSEHILTFIDAILVMYRPLATLHIPLLEGKQDDKLIDETDQAAFGALTATTLASRILMLISHAHHHVVRALWFGLLYLSIAYRGTKRGVALDFLFDAVQAEWLIREDRDKADGSHPWGRSPQEMEMEEEWCRRARSVARLRKKYRTKGGLWLGTVWAEMKGMVQVQPTSVGEESGILLLRDDLPQGSTELAKTTSPDRPRNGDDTPLVEVDFERGLEGTSQMNLSPDA